MAHFKVISIASGVFAVLCLATPAVPQGSDPVSCTAYEAARSTPPAGAFAHRQAQLDRVAALAGQCIGDLTSSGAYSEAQRVALRAGGF